MTPKRKHTAPTRRNLKPTSGPSPKRRARNSETTADRLRLRQLERQLQSAQTVLQELRQFERIYDSIGDGLLIVDRFGHIHRANKQSVRMLGRPLGDLLGRSVVALLDPDGRHRIESAIAVVLDGEVDQLVVSAKIGADSSPVDLRCSLAPLSIRDGLVVFDMHDISELKSALDEKQQQETIAALAGTTAHKLNQPLTAVIGYVQLLRRMNPEGLHDEALTRVETAAQEIADLVREIGRITKFQMQGYGGRHQILKLGS